MKRSDHEMTGEFDRLPPHSIEAEICLLASMMQAGKDDPGFHAMRSAVGSAAAFFQVDHQIIFAALCQMADRGTGIDLVTIRDELAKRQQLEDVGGAAYLAQIISAVPSIAHGQHYAEIMAEKSRLRQMIAAANEMLRSAHGGNDASTIAQEAMTRLAKSAQSGKGCEYVRIDDLLMTTYDELSEHGAELVPMGFRDFDELYGGIAPGEMCVIGARPSMGKSTLLRQIAVKSALGGVPTGLVSLEEGKSKMARNWLASETLIENGRIRRRQLSPGDFNSMAGAVARFADVPLYITDRARRLADIRAMISLWVARYGVRLVLIDYLQRVGGVEGKSAYERVSAISLGLSDIFKELNVAGIVAVQLNRQLTARDDKRPQMADIRKSGQIEQDADGIIFLHRQDYFELDNPSYRPTGEAELIIAKWRDGPRNKIVQLKSDLMHQRFIEGVPIF